MTVLLTVPWNTPAFDRETRTLGICQSCGRRTPHRKDGHRWRHRTQADNPLAPWCEGDDE